MWTYNYLTHKNLRKKQIILKYKFQKLNYTRIINIIKGADYQVWIFYLPFLKGSTKIKFIIY